MLRRQTLTSQVIEHILSLIKTGNMKAGDKLPTAKELTENLGVSRTCVREAVKSLEALQIISVRPRVGAVLLEQSKGALFSAENLIGIIRQEQSDALIDFRNILETGLASLAAERAQIADLVAMRKALDEHTHALETDQAAYNADLAFHVALAKASKNSIAIKILNMILEPLAEQRMRTNDIPGASEDGLRDHRKILKAIEDRQADKARRAMLAHMKTAERYLRIAAANQSQPAESKSRGAAEELLKTSSFT